MPVVRIVLHSAGVRHLLNEPGIRADLHERARRIADAAGDGYLATPAREGAHRAHVAVVAVTDDAKIDEPTTHALLHAIDAGR